MVEGWTEARYWTFIRSALRKAWAKYPNKFKALNEARLPTKEVRTIKDKRGRTSQKSVYVYKCNHCKKHFKGTEVVVDHVFPCGSLKSFDDLPAFTSRLFCNVEDLQVLCKPCHNVKSLEERGINPEVAAFKKLNALGQKKKLRKLNLPEGSNAKARIRIYEEYLDEQQDA